jgi:serine/threonine protein kinase/tetratricopeptide (TPR) repeat protein
MGQVIAQRYLIQELLGQGGSGTVYRALHISLKRPVAVKLLHHHLSNDSAAIERFRREATTVASIDNDHIIQVSDFGQAEDGRFFMVMEYLEGRTLDELIESGELDPEKAIDIVIQICDALIEAHAMGYIHRDLRPRNVFLTQKRDNPYFVKLLDFGLSKLIVPGSESAQSTLGFSFRDPVYLSPEQAQGTSVDRRSDIYSLGVILYELLVGEAPFKGEDVTKLVEKHAEVMPELPSKKNSSLTPAFDALLTKALAKDPASRHITVFAFSDALQKSARPWLAKRKRQGVSKEEKQDSQTEKGGSKDAAVPVHQTDAARGMATAAADPAPDATLLGQVSPARAVAPSQQAATGKETVGKKPAGDNKATVGKKAVAEKESPASVKPEKQKGAPTAVAESSAASAATKAVEKAAASSPKPDAVTESATSAAAQDESAASKVGAGESSALAGDALDGEAGEDSGEKDVEPTAGGETQAAKDSRSERPEKARDPTMSQMWYAEGVEAERQLAEQEASDETQDTLPALYDGYTPDNKPSSKVMFALVGGISLVVVAVLIILLVLSERKETGKKKTAAKTDPTPRAPAPTAVDGGGQRETDGLDGGVRIEKGADGGLLLVPGEELVVERPRDFRAGNDDHRFRAGRRRRSNRNGNGLPRPPDARDKPVDAAVPSTRAQAKKEVQAGRAALRRGDLVGAAAHFIKARNADRRNAAASAGLGEVAFEQGRYSAAIHHLKTSLRLSSRTRTMVLLGNAYFKAGKLSKAKSMYKKVLKRRPGHAEAARNLALVKKRLGAGS